MVTIANDMRRGEILGLAWCKLDGLFKITLNLYSHIYEETNMEVANTSEKFLKLG